MTDPFTAGAAGNDPFDNATTDFIGPEDIDGRLVLFIPKSSGKGKAKDGGEYDYITGDMLVIDGPPTEKIPGPFPHEVKDQRISATMMYSQLRPKLAAQRMLLGRVDSRPSSFNKNVMAYSFAKPEEADVQTGRRYAQPWLDRRSAELASADPFAQA